MILALAATVMAGVCRSSLTRSLAARSAAEELQRRWAVVSLRSAVLPRAGSLMNAAEASAGGPLRSLHRRVELGGQRFELVLADEQAKLDANALIHYRGRAGAQAALDRLLLARGVGAKVKLLAGAAYRGRGAAAATSARENADESDPESRGEPDDSDNPSVGSGRPDDDEPTTDDDETDGDADKGGGSSLFDAERPLQSLSQIFPGAGPARLIGSRAAPGASAEVTCWGDGRLNFARAAPEAVEAAVAPLLAAAQARRLVALRDESPGADLGELATRMGLTDRAQDRLEERLGDDSACHSLWIVAVVRGRAWYHLTVLDTSGGEAAASESNFEW